MVQVARLAGIEAAIVSKAAQAGMQIESKLQVTHICAVLKLSGLHATRCHQSSSKPLATQQQMWC